MDSKQLSEIREMAEKATPVPWDIINDSCEGQEEAWCYWHDVGPFQLVGKTANDNSKFIATCNPQTVLALLAHIDKLTELLQELVYASKESAQVTFGGNMHRYEMYICPSFIADIEKLISLKEDTI
jgi:hypothetical protein